MSLERKSGSLLNLRFADWSRTSADGLFAEPSGRIFNDRSFMVGVAQG